MWRSSTASVKLLPCSSLLENRSLQDATRLLACLLRAAVGLRVAVRRTQEAATAGGKRCTGVSQETRRCGTQGCPKDCQWDAWGAWGLCSKTCGGGELPVSSLWPTWPLFAHRASLLVAGTQVRSRKKKVAEQNGGRCIGKPSQERLCATKACPTSETASADTAAC